MQMLSCLSVLDDALYHNWSIWVHSLSFLCDILFTAYYKIFLPFWQVQTLPRVVAWLNHCSCSWYLLTWCLFLLCTSGLLHSYTFSLQELSMSFCSEVGFKVLSLPVKVSRIALHNVAASVFMLFQSSSHESHWQWIQPAKQTWLDLNMSVFFNQNLSSAMSTVIHFCWNVFPPFYKCFLQRNVVCSCVIRLNWWDWLRARKMDSWEHCSSWHSKSYREPWIGEVLLATLEKSCISLKG